MKNLLSTNKNQSGVGLLEALIAVALSSIIILGGVYSMSRMLVSQQQNNLQYIVINELRAKLQGATAEEKEKWCAGDSKPTITLPKEDNSIYITVTCKKVDINIINSNSTYNKKIPDELLPIKFEINEASLGGKITVGEELE
uniref:type IV pilus modification PilV family protein n=1 Tax=Psychrobacter sp. TaxID=56811 RepID=UPI001599607F|nr:prepilin-type N-terminal cleavage/methylation domain-containing protein [Psychrobacter sp.]QJS05713.1 pilus assembly protein PilV [Psychrobacter sp.]